MPTVSYAQHLTNLATADPDRPVITCGDESLTRAQFDEAANRLARDFAPRGVSTGDMVTVALPNSVAWFVAVAACWKLGAIPQPVSSRLPARELEAIVELADPKIVVGVDTGTFADRTCLPAGYEPPADLDGSPLPDAVSPAWKAPTSGGSTGRPKLIVAGDPSTLDDEVAPALFPAGSTLVMPGPLYHNG